MVKGGWGACGVGMMQVDYMEKTLSISGVTSSAVHAGESESSGRDRRLRPIGYNEVSTQDM